MDGQAPLCVLPRRNATHYMLPGTRSAFSHSAGDTGVWRASCHKGRARVNPWVFLNSRAQSLGQSHLHDMQGTLSLLSQPNVLKPSVKGDRVDYDVQRGADF